MNLLNLNVLFIAIIVGLASGIGISFVTEAIANENKEPISIQINFIVVGVLAGVTAAYGIIVAIMLMGSI